MHRDSLLNTVRAALSGHDRRRTAPHSTFHDTVAPPRGTGSAGPTPILATRLLANGGVDTAFAAAGTVSAGDPLLHHPVGHAATADVRGTLLVSRVASGWDVVRIRPANDERISLDGFE